MKYFVLPYSINVVSTISYLSIASARDTLNQSKITCKIFYVLRISRFPLTTFISTYTFAYITLLYVWHLSMYYVYINIHIHIYIYIKVSSHYISSHSFHWRDNEHDGVSNHQPHGCLLNRLFRRRSQKTSKLRVTGLCVGNSLGPVNSPHKGPVTRKMFPFDDVIMLHEPLTL